MLQVFRQQLALYLRAETHRRRDKKGEKVEKIEEVVEERHPGPSENTNTPSFMTDESTYHLKITKKNFRNLDKLRVKWKDYIIHWEGDAHSPPMPNPKELRPN